MPYNTSISVDPDLVDRVNELRDKRLLSKTVNSLMRDYFKTLDHVKKNCFEIKTEADIDSFVERQATAKVGYDTQFIRKSTKDRLMAFLNEGSFSIDLDTGEITRIITV